MACDVLPELSRAVPDLSTREEDYRQILALDWRRWRSG